MKNKLIILALFLACTAILAFWIFFIAPFVIHLYGSLSAQGDFFRHLLGCILVIMLYSGILRNYREMMKQIFRFLVLLKWENGYFNERIENDDSFRPDLFQDIPCLEWFTKWVMFYRDKEQRLEVADEVVSETIILPFIKSKKVTLQKLREMANKNFERENNVLEELRKSARKPFFEGTMQFLS